MNGGRNKNISLALAFSFLILMLVLGHHVRARSARAVVRVIDGDTLQIEDGRIIRLIGVDAPEVQSPFSKEEPFGQESRDYLDSLVRKKKVLIKPGDPPFDRDHRTTAYVYSGDILVNGRMIRDGWAASNHAADHPWRDLFLSYENEARSKGLGIWKKTDPGKSDQGPE